MVKGLIADANVQGQVGHLVLRMQANDFASRRPGLRPGLLQHSVNPSPDGFPAHAGSQRTFPS